MMYEMI